VAHGMSGDGSCGGTGTGDGGRGGTGPDGTGTDGPTPTGLIRVRFGAAESSVGADVTAGRSPLGRWMRRRPWQFMLILPNQILFWVVIVVGFVGTADPNLNFATAITWYVWFCLVFVMIVAVGRGWCAVCPFGGLGEWVQRGALWKRRHRSFTLGLEFPERLSRYGFLVPVATFLVLTWLEEHFEIAGPGAPPLTSWMVIGIVAFALSAFLVFRRRTFCAHLCPLSGLIGALGGQGMVGGFRTRDRSTCRSCVTKECMRGGEKGYGCPWFTWPGSSESNLSCGLCSECYKACPNDNVGLFLQRPLASLTTPVRRRADVGWAVAVLFGLVVFQQVNATDEYGRVDDWLEGVTRLGSPNPLDYLAVIGGVTAVLAGAAALIGRSLRRPGLLAVVTTSDSFIDRQSRFRAFFLPLMYVLVPLVGSDYFARQLPKFFNHAAAVLPAFARLFGRHELDGLATVAMLPNSGVVAAQLGVIGLGAVGSLLAGWRIAGNELGPLVRRPAAARLATVAFVVACAVAAGWLYLLINGAE